MSAFMCSDRHITTLAAYAVRHGISGLVEAGYPLSAELRARESRAKPEPTLVESAFKMLARANRESLDARYPNDPGESLGSVCTRTLAEVESFNPIHVIKACHCFAYQACESTTWEESVAKAMLTRIEGHAVRALPGYEAAPWGL